jgi:hypothetical protein
VGRAQQMSKSLSGGQECGAAAGGSEYAHPLLSASVRGSAANGRGSSLRRPVDQLNAQSLKVVRRHPSLAEAACFAGIGRSTMASMIQVRARCCRGCVAVLLVEPWLWRLKQDTRVCARLLPPFSSGPAEACTC